MQRPNDRLTIRAEQPPARRFPFPSLPKGWFVIAMSEELKQGEILTLHYFGRELIAFRSEAGKASVIDAYCPHLGAHFAHGGKIVGDTIQCPYHGWRFDGQGTCVEVPYSDRIPPKAKVDAWPVLEQDGCIYMFFSPVPFEPGEPWPLPPIELGEYMPGKLIHWHALRTHPQEVCENTVDTAHILPVHDGRGAHVIGEPVRDGNKLVVDLEFEAPGSVVDMPNTWNDVALHVTLHGLGHLIVETHVRNVDVFAMQRIYCTPIDEHSIDLRGVVHVKPTDDPVFSQELAQVFYRAYVEDFARDFPIWENKRYEPRPTLARGDGPIGVYRRWSAQFYVDPEGRMAPADDEPRARPQPGPRVDVPAGASLLRMLDPVRARVSEQAEALLARVPWLPRRTRERSDADPHEHDEAPPARKPTSKAKAKAEPYMRITSVDEYVDTLPQRFVASAAGGVDAVFQWELSGAGARTFHAIVRDGALTIVEGAHADPTTTLAISAADYVQVVNGDLDGMKVFATGRGKVKGNIKAAMKMRDLFPA
jgi:phenylpropionate dioxygenase-like ring-hydroxylating dioxygenase large terminal subunit/putative sterol carrier protein